LPIKLDHVTNFLTRRLTIEDTMATKLVSNYEW